MSSIQEWTEAFAKYTWQRLGFVHRNPQARLHETTITDDLVFQVAQKFGSGGFAIVLEHAKNEQRNGNDIELIIAHNDRYLKFPTQAKRIYARQRYPRFSHKGQLEALLSYSQEVGGVPLYLLYNYLPNNFSHPGQLFGKRLTIEHYGCTLVKAEYISANYAYALKRRPNNKWKIPTFTSLHPDFAYPWHLLFHNPDFFISGESSLPKNQIGFPIKYYSKEELLEDEGWRPVTNHAQQQEGIMVFNQDYSNSVASLRDDNRGFLPRFRLIINP